MASLTSALYVVCSGMSSHLFSFSSCANRNIFGQAYVGALLLISSLHFGAYPRADSKSMHLRYDRCPRDGIRQVLVWRSTHTDLGRRDVDWAVVLWCGRALPPSVQPVRDASTAGPILSKSGGHRGWVRVAIKPSDELLRRSETHIHPTPFDRIVPVVVWPMYLAIYPVLSVPLEYKVGFGSGA